MVDAEDTVPPLSRPCEVQKEEYLRNKGTVEGKWNGALEKINEMISAAETEAAKYPLGSPCQVAFQDFADKMKAKRDAYQDVYTTGMAGLVEINCDDPDWQEKLLLCDQILGQVMNAIDGMWKLYRDARKKDIDGPCEDFSDWEPDTTLCSMLKSDAEALYNAAMAKFDDLIRQCQENIDRGGADEEVRNNWLNTRTDIIMVKSCFQANYPPEVSCSHKEWEAKHNRRLGAAQIMFDVANCISGNIFAT